MRTTQEYFNMTKKALQEVRNEYGYTKEECLLFDESINTQFYSDDESSLNGCDWLRSPHRHPFKRSDKWQRLAAVFPFGAILIYGGAYIWQI